MFFILAFQVCTTTRLSLSVPRLLALRGQSRLQQTTVLNSFFFFFEKIRLDISCEFFARLHVIHMKHQALFSSADKSIPKIKVSSAALLHGSFFKG